MKKYLILFAGCTLLMAACSDFLELDESVYQTTKYQFSTFDRVKQSATNVYSYVQEGLLDVEGTMIDAATDDAVYAWSTGGIKRFYDGSWNGTNLIDDRWASLYSAIAAANYFLDNCPDDFPEAQYQDNYKTNLFHPPVGAFYCPEISRSPTPGATYACLFPFRIAPAL